MSGGMHMIRFGTGGWRAIIGEDFIMDNVRLLSQAVAEDIKTNKYEDKGFVIGYDRRFLSDRAARWIAEVIAGNGIKVFFIGNIAPTPMIMFTVKKLGARYGAAVTASHNPADYNGVKMFTEGGRDATEDVTRRLEGIIAGLRPEDIRTTKFEEGVKDGSIQIIDPFNDYIDTILSMIDIDVIRHKGLKVLLDPMFGVSKSSLQTILLTARCQVDIINDRHDTLFGGRLPSPSAATLTRLRDIVLERGYDLGIATDGDADRLGIIDDKGNFIHPNDIMVLLYYYLLKFKGWKGGVVRNIATTNLLDKLAAAFGEECYEVPVGFKHISSKMEEKDAVIGGESSGGLTIRGHIKGKDGIFAGSLLVEMICATGKKISELLDEIHSQLGELFMEENDFRFSEQQKNELIEILFEQKKLPDFGYEIRNVSYRDGCKVYFENDGWIIARFSGTEPLLRIFSEMPTREEAKKTCEIMQSFLSL
jgi:phosphomannomutase